MTPQPAAGGLPREIDSRARALRLLLFDVDGVLTDGRILLHADGSESKQYHIRDGSGLVWARRAGLLTGLLSARSSLSTTQRAQQLGIPIVRQGVDEKLTAYEQILAEHGLTDAEVAFMGDDLLDLPVLTRVGLSCAPADAAPEVRTRVHWVSGLNGGAGAVRELVELVLRAQGRWQAIIERYLPVGATDAPSGAGRDAAVAPAVAAVAGAGPEAAADPAPHAGPASHPARHAASKPDRHADSTPDAEPHGDAGTTGERSAR